MGIFLRQSHNVKSLRWGSPADVQYSIWRNLEDIYGCDHESEVLIMPGFWGFPLLDYSGKNNHGTNHGATYKNGSLDFEDVNYVEINDSNSLDISSNYTISLWAKKVGNGEFTPLDKYVTIGDQRSFDLQLSYNLFKFETSPDGTLANLQTISGSYFFPINELHQATIVKNGSTITLYRDAVFDTSQGGINDTYQGTAPLYINGDVHNSPANNIIDEVRIAKATRTADQIALFNDRPWDLYRRVARPIWSIPAVGGIGVSATIDSLSLIENVVNINAEVNISAGADVLVITEAVATIKVDSDIQADIDALVITENVAIIKVDNNVQAGADALVLTENPATVNAEISMGAGTDVLALTENVADINLGVNVSAGIDALAIAESVANVNAKVSISAGIDILTLTENIAEVNAETNISASINTLILSPFAANIKVDIDIQATLETLVIAEYSASVATEAGSTKFISEQLGLNQMQGLF